MFIFEKALVCSTKKTIMKIVDEKELNKQLTNFINNNNLKEIIITSPYLGTKAKEIFSSFDKEVFVSLTTTSDGKNYLKKQMLLDKIDELVVNDTLHAKTMIIESEEDTFFSYIGSSNLSSGGFKYNKELNIVLDNISDKKILQELREKVLKIKNPSLYKNPINKEC